MPRIVFSVSMWYACRVAWGNKEHKVKLETGQVKKSRSGKTSYVIMALSKSKVDPGGVQFFWRVGKVSRRGLVRNGSLARRINKTVLKG